LSLKKSKKEKIDKLNKNLNDENECEDLSDQDDFDDDDDEDQEFDDDSEFSQDEHSDFSDIADQADSADENEGFFKKPQKPGQKAAKNEKYLPPGKRAQIQEENKKPSKKVHFYEDMNDEKNLTEDEDDFEGEEDYSSEEDEKYEDGDESDNDDDEAENVKNGLKEDIYGRLINKEGDVVKSEKYVPPAQRLKTLIEQASSSDARKLTNLSKQLNGLLNRLSTANMHSISNQIIQMFYSNQYTRYDLIETLFNLLNNSLIQKNNVSPIRLIIEHAAIVAILSANIGVELGANILQKFANIINKELIANTSDSTFSIENKTLDNLILFICNLYNFKLFSSSLLNDLLSDFLIENLTPITHGVQNSNETIKVEKSVDLILVILRCVGFSLRKDDPVALKNIIVKLQAKINDIKSKLTNNLEVDASINGRLKFMIESVNAIKNNDVRRLDAYDQQPIELIRKQMRTMLKEEKDSTQLNITFKDLVNANELGRWWIVGSAWSLKENAKNEGETKDGDETGNASDFSSNGQIYSEKILQLAKAQHMNTDIRRAIFCIIVTAEVYY
jgi:nucleolar MIF4G domain-containing protein 1